jgi:hypothetical protein
VLSGNLTRRLISFAVLLPLLDFVIWAAFAFTPVALQVIQSQDLSIGPKEAVNVDYTFNVRRDDLYTIPLTEKKVSRSHTIGTIGLPATIVETVISAPSVFASSWHSADFHLDSLRTFAYPLVCLPVWWFVGRGADGLFGKRRIGLPSKATGTVIMLLFVVIVIGLRSASHGNDPNGDFNWIFRALGIWILMFAVFPLVWLKQAFIPRLTEMLRKHIAK